jgi:hypothetical protein
VLTCLSVRAFLPLCVCLLVPVSAYPFPLRASEVMVMVMSGARHSKPSACPEWLYGTVLQCWDIEPSKRPTFSQVERTIREASVQKIFTRADDVGVDADSTGGQYGSPVKQSWQTPCSKSADLTDDAAQRSLSSRLSHYEYSDHRTATTPTSSSRARCAVSHKSETSSSESLLQPVCPIDSLGADDASPTDSLRADDASDGLFPNIGTLISEYHV